MKATILACVCLVMGLSSMLIAQSSPGKSQGGKHPESVPVATGIQGTVRRAPALATTNVSQGATAAAGAAATTVVRGTESVPLVVGIRSAVHRTLATSVSQVGDARAAGQGGKITRTSTSSVAQPNAAPASRGPVSSTPIVRGPSVKPKAVPSAVPPGAL